MEKITREEFEKAYEIVERYKYQQKPETIEVSIQYNAVVDACVNVPADWNIDKIKKELKNGYYNFDLEDEVDIKLGKIIYLVVDGDEIIK